MRVLVPARLKDWPLPRVPPSANCSRVVKILATPKSAFIHAIEPDFAVPAIPHSPDTIQVLEFRLHPTFPLIPTRPEFLAREFVGRQIETAVGKGGFGW
jgi:hypothetical protein